MAVPWAHIDITIQQYCARLDQLSSELQLHDKPEVPAVVLLTGSTGNLGSYLLSTLVRDERVDRVYCLNRISATGVSSKERQKKTLKELGLDVTALASPKVVMLEGDTTQDKFGLIDEIFAQVHASVTTIIHNAWNLNFNLPLSSFETHLVATRKLLEVASTAPHASRLRFLLTSSVLSVQSWPLSKGDVREDTKVESKFALGSGYGEAKHVAQCMLERSGLQATSLRIGQVVCPSWSITEWASSGIWSGVQMGSLPTMPGLVSWLPAQGIADAIIDVMFVQQQPPSMLNLYHPRPATWAETMELIRAEIKKRQPKRELSLIPTSQWLLELERLAQGADKQRMRSLPAIKLLAFLRRINRAIASDTEEAGGFPRLNCDKMREISPSFASMQPLGKKDIEGWVSYWASRGMFKFYGHDFAPL